MAEPSPIEIARALLTRAITERLFPAAVAEVGRSSGVLWREAFGTLTFEPPSVPAHEHTIFDLASLAKPIATTSVCLQLVADGAISLDDQLSMYFPEWRGADRDGAVVQDLLEHSSGLAARLVDVPPEGRREFEHDICAMPLEYPRRAQSIYSDLGFILLGFAAADRGGDALDVQFSRILARLVESTRDQSNVHGDPGLTFGVSADLRAETAPTLPMDEDVRRGRMLVGEVHDNYASALGGVAGHAGLFGTAPAVGAFARAALRSARGDHRIASPLTPALVQRAISKSTVPRSSRGLGWDTMLPTSSCGSRLSPAAFGHPGFTGTSLWIDPVLDRYFVLLTNRVCGGGTPAEMRTLRRAFHDALSRL
jgi:CubicO group peptidase (beta-lactamase class C family)